MLALYQADVTGRPAAELLGRDVTRSPASWSRGREAERAELDALIERHATGWSLDRIAPLERNILRVALHELRSRPDVPAEVAIDEAIEAAKELCSAERPAS